METNFLNPKLSVFYVLSRVLHPESNLVGRALLESACDPFCERSLDPFCFSQGASFEKFTVLPFSEKKIKYVQLYTDVSSDHGAYFEYIASETDILETGVCRHFFQNEIPKKWLVGCQGKRARFSHFPGVKRDCGGVETSIFVFF